MGIIKLKPLKLETNNNRAKVGYSPSNSLQKIMKHQSGQVDILESKLINMQTLAFRMNISLFNVQQHNLPF